MPNPGGLPELSTVAALLGPVVAIYGKALLESLAAHTADGVVQLPRTIRKRWFGRTGAESSDLAAILDIEGGPGAAAILVTEGLPDEARLALLDIDPTESALRGKVLGWDDTLQRWIPRAHPDTQGRPG
ncbi:hypothetical protein [Nocardia altamirensis]|uniref:hypothetical protein n=1 Tax=Nocardia altamirensis TaxID=472158 RepID=UPI00114CE986|nr:hypothetical protein [Nocardia altamirensis]